MKKYFQKGAGCGRIGLAFTAVSAGLVYAGSQCSEPSIAIGFNYWATLSGLVAANYLAEKLWEPSGAEVRRQRRLSTFHM